MSSKIKHYTNGEVTVVWNPELCHHAGECVKGLPAVFKPKERPWINPAGCDSEALKSTINKCPSGALSYLESIVTIEQITNKENMTEEKKDLTLTRAQVIPNGPILIHTHLSVEKADGSTEIRENKSSLCRCGASNNKPFCDGTHKKIGWEG